MRSILLVIAITIMATVPAGCVLVRPYPDSDDRGSSYPPGQDDDHVDRVPQPGSDRQTLAAHPRLMIAEADIQRLKLLIRDDPLARQWHQIVRQRAVKLLDEPVLSDRADTLQVSREVLRRVTTLAAMYRLSGEERFARRGIDQMLAAAGLSDWDPSDFLATAEMTNALAIGYDWLYNAMTPRQRELIRNAIVDKGLHPGLEVYDGGTGWVTALHNWNLVCNGGMIVGALAVQEDEPRMAKRILAKARESIRNGMRGFAPDGAWEEGPTYWNYATRYACFALAALRTAYRTDWGLLRSPGFANTGMFRIYTTGPTGLPFNFADAESVIGNSAQMLWMAQAFNRPVYAAFEQQFSARDPGVFDLLWYRPVDPELVQRLPSQALFRGVDLVCLRGGWDDPDATYIACKGGSNDAHHGHLDLGTFVLDAQGQRWAVGLGGDNYNLPGYFGDRRWTYYRASTRGQNAITLDNRNQETQARTTVSAFVPRPDQAQAVIDLTEAYHLDARRTLRGISLLNQSQVLIQDEIDLTGTSDIRWNFHTTAEVELAGPLARLRQGGKTMTVRILHPEGAKFEVYNGNPPPPQAQTPDLKRLAIRLPHSRGKVRIAVLFTPGQSTAPAPRLTPLNQWKNR